MYLILILYALFGSTFTLGDAVVRVMPPLLFISIRMILSGLLLLGFVKIQHKKDFKFNIKHLPWFLGIIFFHIYLSYSSEYFSFQYLSSAKVALFYNLSPFITALFAYFIFKEIMTPRKWLGLAIGFGGFLPLLESQAPSIESTLGNFGFISVAEIIALVSVTSACIGWIFLKKLTTDFNYSYIFVNGFGMLFGGILALITSHSTETWPAFDYIFYSFPFWRSLLLLILIGNVICFNLYGKLLHTYSTTMLAFFGFITPLFTAFFSWVWLGESVSTAFFLTIGLVTCGLYIFYQEELKLGYITHK
ncbi:DMT family transporter [Candidatus Babeliales bacterium]|nr:DMT family transporter [Candidatus Babeliales bacterium]